MKKELKLKTSRKGIQRVSETLPKLPVFVSCLNCMNTEQEKSAFLIRRLLEKNNLEWIAPKSNQYSPETPIKMVLRLIQKCHGGLIIGFERLRAPSGVLMRGTTHERTSGPQVIASPWHQIEATAIFACNLPFLIFREPGVQEGVFDRASSDYPLYNLPKPNQSMDWLEKVISEWADKVHEHYEKINSLFDVFLSFSGEDELPARRIFEFLTSKGLRVFFSRESIPKLGQADYMKAINEALDKARHMIVVSSSAKGFAKPWVEREWTMFLNEKLSGRKGGNVVVVQAGDIPVAALPIQLRSQQVINLTMPGLVEMLKFVSS